MVVEVVEVVVGRRAVVAVVGGGVGRLAVVGGEDVVAGAGRVVLGTVVGGAVVVGSGAGSMDEPAATTVRDGSWAGWPQAAVRARRTTARHTRRMCPGIGGAGRTL
jgi:hypothetical protein